MDFLKALRVSLPLLSVLVLSHAYAGAEAYVWQKAESSRTAVADLDAGDRGGKLKVRLDGRNADSVNESCVEDQCFELYYFKGRNFDLSDARRKNVIFVPGGPGQIPPRRGGIADVLEKEHNVLYFDIRGSGLSQIPRSNAFDKFLRAEYVAADIERLRRNVLGENRNWDIVYAHSYGTIIAQHYASRYAANVERLILSAPIARHRETDGARRLQVLNNLENIYKFIRSKDPGQCDCSSQAALKAEPIPFEGGVLPTHNFCFLNEDQISTIRENVSGVYTDLETRYGSVAIVTEHYEELENDPGFIKSFPYPQAFFFALRQLQLMEAPQENGSLLFGEKVNRLVNAAMLIGYYGMMEREDLVTRQAEQWPACTLSTPFFSAVDTTQACACVFCKSRVDGARQQIEGQSDGPDSVRALYAAGAFDGMHRWMFRILNEYGKAENECLSGEAIRAFAQDDGPAYRILKNQAKKIGVASEDTLCPWNPAGITHRVPTLVLKGGADAVIAGCQAEDFFNDGLLDETKRVLLEFPGMGHMPFFRKKVGLIVAETEWEIAYGKLLGKFANASVSEYRESITGELKTLRGVDRTPAPGARAACVDMEPVDEQRSRNVAAAMAD